MHFVHLFIDWWKFELFPPFGYYANATMNIRYKFCVELFSFLMNMYLEVELLSNPLTFWRTVKLFSKVAEPFYIPISNVGKV
jgi:hypothetical protein